MINGKKVLAITLARGGSKRVKNKNRTLVSGSPLIKYTCDEVLQSKYIDKYIVSTDDKITSNLINLLYEKNSPTIFMRNKASDTQTTADGLMEVFDGIYPEDYDIIVEVMATNPLKTVKDIDNTIEKIFDGDSAVSVVRVWDHHPSRIKYISDGSLQDFYPEIPESRRQDLLPEAYVRNGSIYVMWKNDLYENKRRLNGKIVPYIMSEENTINIDEPIDLLVAEQLINQKNA